jgi:dipeptidyl aminopeptidase/acylaminoacyl peptidase
MNRNIKPALVGGIGEINFGKQYRQGNRIYSADAIAMALNAGPIGNAGGYSYLYTVREGENVDNEEARRAYSLELHVDENTVPTYIWHTCTDGTVPVENTLLFMSALAKSKVRFEAHIFPEGRHGSSLANDQTCSGIPELIIPEAMQWIDEAIDWTKRV